MASTAVIILILSIILWIIYYLSFRDQPDKGITAVIVGFSALCVFIVRGIINHLRKKEKQG
jgi:hypothetical protein